ncbi:MAG: PilZ domain-containing protein, partial [bacterium]|nr:PilZ domain-containing protein [bacterium]
ISRYGISLSSEQEVIPDREVEISIAVPGDVFTLKGEVVWCKKSTNGSTDIPDDIGIKIVEAPAEYLNYLEYLKHQSIKPGEPEF